ncbi:MAG: DUF192 domain-containing protein [Patescibacteria group bacterium]|jgi:hypothetical protein
MKNYKWLVIFVIFILFVAGIWLKISNTNVVKNFKNTEPTNKSNQNINTEADNASQIIINNKTFFVEVATDPATQRQGLSARQSLNTENGMLFAYAEKKDLHFWMLDMKFNIDLLWINDDKVVGIEKNMPVPLAGAEDKDLLIYSSPEPVNRVLEINSGLADQYGLKVGDSLEYKNINF